MKKILSYAAAAILLGTVTMLAPLMLLEYRYYGQLTLRVERLPVTHCFGATGNKTETHGPDNGETWDLTEAFGLTKPPSLNLFSAGLMLIPSFLLALGISLYMKKRIF